MEVHKSWRFLAVFCGTGEELQTCNGAVDEVIDWPVSHLEVSVLRSPTLKELGQHILVWQPNFVYFTGTPVTMPPEGKLPSLTWRASEDHSSLESSEDLAMIFQGLNVDTVLMDAVGCSQSAKAIQEMGVPNVIFWATAAVQAAHAMQFSRTFLSSLRDPLSSSLEAFAIAAQSMQAHCATLLHAELQIWPALPYILSESRPSLPDADTVPSADIQGVAVGQGGIVTGIEGWRDIRLCAPQAELRLLFCGATSLMEPKRMGALGFALRAVLAQETRCLQLLSHQPCLKAPSHLPDSLAACLCKIKSQSGLHFSVQLAGPPALLERPEIIQLALRYTLTTDALSLQLKLPPIGQPLPQPKSLVKVACGVHTVDVTAVLSVWAVTLLKSLCQEESSRLLSLLGVAAVGNSASAAFNATDAACFSRLLPDIPRTSNRRAAQAPNWQKQDRELSEEPSGSQEREDDTDWSRQKRKRTKSRLARADDSDSEAGASKRRKSHIAYTSNRPAIMQCTEEEFMEDYCKFSSSQMGRKVTPDTWPDSVLNGIPLDVFHLYREVVTRGGIAMGNGINWKGQVFPSMRNYTPTHRMTGIGNALKTKYQQLLLDYEKAHPEDVTSASDTCFLCGRAEALATDWVSCDKCNSWVHFSCDERPGMGTFKDYAKTDGLMYICKRCAA